MIISKKVLGFSMSNCEVCGSQLSELQKYCSECGNRTASSLVEADDSGAKVEGISEIEKCSVCAASLEPDARFCTQCGETVQSTRKIYRPEPIKSETAGSAENSSGDDTAAAAGLLGGLMGTAGCGCGCLPIALIFLGLAVLGALVVGF